MKQRARGSGPGPCRAPCPLHLFSCHRAFPQAESWQEVPGLPCRPGLGFVRPPSAWPPSWGWILTCVHWGKGQRGDAAGPGLPDGAREGTGAPSRSGSSPSEPAT